MKFYGFSGRPAKSVADCSWDFFGCTKRLGSWPKNKKCCQQRFDDCCMIVMGKRPIKIIQMLNCACQGYLTGTTSNIFMLKQGFLKNY